MSRINGTTYKCDRCNLEERKKTDVFHWLVVTSMRGDVAPTRGINTQWKKDFCSLECLIEWAKEIFVDKLKTANKKATTNL